MQEVAAKNDHLESASKRSAAMTCRRIPMYAQMTRLDYCQADVKGYGESGLRASKHMQRHLQQTAMVQGRRHMKSKTALSKAGCSGAKPQSLLSGTGTQGRAARSRLPMRVMHLVPQSPRSQAHSRTRQGHMQNARQRQKLLPQTAPPWAPRLPGQMCRSQRHVPLSPPNWHPFPRLRSPSRQPAS